MLRNFYPYAYVNDMFHIDYAALYQQGYRAIIFDIDNTLVHTATMPIKKSLIYLGADVD